jgi:transposase
MAAARRAFTVPDNITLLPLPSYAPELNPIENVWEYLRSNQLSLRVWNSYEASRTPAKTPGML